MNVEIAQRLAEMRREKGFSQEELAARLGLAHTPTLYPAIAGDALRVTMRVECPCEPDECWALEREIRLSLYERLRKEEIKT